MNYKKILLPCLFGFFVLSGYGQTLDGTAQFKVIKGDTFWLPTINDLNLVLNPAKPVGSVISPTETLVVGDSTNTIQALIDLMQDSIPEHTGTQGSVFFAGADGKPTEDNANLFWDDTNNRLRINNSIGTYSANIQGKIWIDDGASNVSLGKNNLSALSSGTGNVTIGTNAGNSVTTGHSNVLIGLSSATTGNPSSSVGIGLLSLSKSTGSNNVAIGPNSGQNATSGLNNSFIGWSAGQALTTGSSNVFLGVGAGNLGNPSSSIHIGQLSGQKNSGQFNSLIGYYGGAAITTGNRNTIIGTHIRAPTTANRSVLVGADDGNVSGPGAGSGYDTVTDMVVIGNLAASSTLTAGDAGREDEGKQGVIIGYNAAKDPVNTDSSIIIGAHAGVSNDKRNIMLLGYGAVADQDGQIVLGTSVGGYTQLKSRNYKFNIDQTVGAGTDNYVMTYDNTTGEIGLEQNSTSYPTGSEIAPTETMIVGDSTATVQQVIDLMQDSTLANNGLSKTSNNTIQLGSATNAASGTSADLTSARYIPMNGNKLEFRGTTITSANYPNLTIADDGDITAGVKDVTTTSASLTGGWGDMKYSRYWSNFSVGRNISGANWKTIGDGRVISSAFFGEGLVGRQMRASILFGSNNTVDYAGTTASPIINSVLGGRNTLFGGIATESLVISSASNLDNTFANSILVANTDTITGTMQNSLYLMLQANAAFGSATNNKNNLAISDNVTLNGNFRNNIFTLTKGTYSDAASTVTDPVFQNSSGSIISGVMYADDGAKSLSYGIATGYRQHYSGWGQFLLGGNIKSVANNTFCLNLAGPASGVTYATTSAWDIDNTTSNKMIVAAPNGYQFGTGTSPAAFATGVTLASGANSWASISDKDKKTNYQDVNSAELLDWFRTKNIQKWQYKSEGNARHVGFYAQDFHSSPLGKLGQDELKIETIDGIGMNSALIQALLEKVDELEARIKTLENK